MSVTHEGVTSLSVTHEGVISLSVTHESVTSLGVTHEDVHHWVSHTRVSITGTAVTDVKSCLVIPQCSYF